jgi:hypothetical protein
MAITLIRLECCDGLDQNAALYESGAVRIGGRSV